MNKKLFFIRLIKNNTIPNLINNIRLSFLFLTWTKEKKKQTPNATL